LCHSRISRAGIDLKHHRHRSPTRNCNLWLTAGQTAGTDIESPLAELHYACRVGVVSASRQPAKALRPAKLGQGPRPPFRGASPALARFGDEAANLEGHGGRHGGRSTSRGLVGPFVSEPGLGGHRVVVFPEDRLDVLSSGGRPPCCFADDRCRSFCCVPELLRLDPDPVELRRRRVPPCPPHLTTHGSPPCGDQRRQNLGRGLLCLTLDTRCEGQAFRSCVQSVHQIEVALARQSLRQPSCGLTSLHRQSLADGDRCLRQPVREYIEVPQVAQYRPEPFQLMAEVVAPQRIEDVAERIQIRTDPSRRDTRLVDILDRGIRRGEPQLPVACEEAIQTCLERAADDVCHRRLLVHHLAR